METYTMIAGSLDTPIDCKFPERWCKSVKEFSSVRFKVQRSFSCRTMLRGPFMNTARTDQRMKSFSHEQRGEFEASTISIDLDNIARATIDTHDRYG
jgi:hypothetical protein